MSEIKLILDTILKNGSAAIFDEKIKIGAAAFSENDFKSENLLEEIENLLKNIRIDRRAIKRIYVTESPGSITRNRVFKSIGLGLRNALDADLKIVPAETLFGHLVKGKPYISVFESGKGMINVLEYSLENEFSGKSKIIKNAEFIDYLHSSANIKKIFITESLLQTFQKEIDGKDFETEVIDGNYINDILIKCV